MLILYCGNIGLIALGCSRTPQAILERAGTLLAGVVGMMGSLFFLAHGYRGLGIGGMERVGLFPLLLWCLVAGGALLTVTRRGHSVVV